MQKTKFSNKPRRRLDIAEVKQNIAPAVFYRRELLHMPEPRRREGWTSGGLCPFHPDTRAQNFRVNVGTGAYHCFSCGVGGRDIVDFIRRRYGVSLAEALKRLAEDWGLS